MTERETLFDGDDIVVLRRQAGGTRGIVTFSPWSVSPLGDRPAAGARGFGEDRLVREGLDELHIIARRNHWYCCPDRERALALARAFAADHRCITYGPSMGGHGAALFSSWLGIPALSIAPQFTLSPDLAPFEIRWREDVGVMTGFDVASDAPERSATGFLFYDPMVRLDRRQAELFRASSSMTLVPVPFSGHGTARMINRFYGLTRLAVEMTDACFRPEVFHHARRADRRRNDLYRTLLHVQAVSRRPALAAETYRWIEANREQLGLKSLSALFALALRLRDREAAEGWADLAFAVPQTKPVDDLVVARMYRRLGDSERALAVLDRGIAREGTIPILMRERQTLQ